MFQCVGNTEVACVLCGLDEKREVSEQKPAIETEIDKLHSILQRFVSDHQLPRPVFDVIAYV